MQLSVDRALAPEDQDFQTQCQKLLDNAGGTAF